MQTRSGTSKIACWRRQCPARSDLIMSASLPGTTAHQALLRTIIDAYAGDERVLAIGVLGSLGRGTWDEWSDLDLDIVVTDDALIDAVGEAQVVCERIGHAGALVVPSRPGDARPARVPEVIASNALRFALSVDVSLRRGNIWQALRSLDELRWRIEELFAVTGGYSRPAHAVDAHASAALKDKPGASQAQADVDSIAHCLARALELISDEELTHRRLVLTPAQQAGVSALRLRRPLSGAPASTDC